jgi:DNA polymerase V
MLKTPIAIADCNSFYASCERSMDPRLKNKAIVVLSNNDGVIIALNKEAKDLGIKNFTPYFQVEKIIKYNDVRVFSANFRLYDDISRKVMNILRQYSPNVEVYSIDEAFIKLDGLERLGLTNYCREIRAEVLNKTSIPISIGVANTKTLAKLANRIVKKDESYNGVLNFLEFDNLDNFLKITEVGDIWGIGRRYDKLLKSFNVRSAYDLINVNDTWVRSKMTVVGLRTVQELRGFPTIPMNYNRANKKMIMYSRSFGNRLTDYRDLEETIAYFTCRAAERMRLQGSAANFLTVYLRTSAFDTRVSRYVADYTIKLPVPTEITSELINFAKEALNKIFKKDRFYSKAGILLSNLVPTSTVQMNLFDQVDRVKHAKVVKAMDLINKKFGTDTIKPASLGNRDPWLQRQNRLSDNKLHDKEKNIISESTISFLN